LKKPLKAKQKKREMLKASPQFLLRLF